MVIARVKLNWRRVRQLPGLTAGLTAILAIWLLSAFLALRALDHVAYDFVVDLMGEPDSAAYEVTLVETAPDARPDWSSLAAGLLQAGARQIVFVLPLTTDELRRLAELPGAPRQLLIGLPPRPGRDGRAALPPQALPDDLAQRLRIGILATPADEPGSPHRQRADYRLGSRLWPTIERLAAEAAGRTVPRVFGINYHRGTTLPRLSAARLQREAPLPEMVRGKTVLVGFAPTPHLAHFEGPGYPVARQLTELELHGLATDSLLQGKAVREFGPWFTAATLFVFGAALLFLFQPLRYFTAFWVSVALLAANLPLAQAALHAFDLWPPILELALANLLVFVLVFRAKARLEDRRMRALLAETAGKLQNRLLPPGFVEADEHWSHVASLVDQVLHLNRTLFLERIPNDHRVKEIKALRCSVGDIHEMRRDYQRAPYTDAIAQRGLVEIDVARRPYLTLRDEGERQFLVPLMFGREVLGFWAFGLDGGAVGDDARFRATVDSLAQQIGHLLYQRQIWLTHARTEGTAWQRYLSDDAFALFSQLSQAIVALERRVASFENLFAALSSAAIVFDLFGRVVLINDRMSRLLAGAGIKPYEMTAADLLERLSGQSRVRVRETVQALLSSSAPVVIPVVVEAPARESFILSVRSLEHRGERPSPGALRDDGLLIELIDVGDISHLYTAKAELASRLNAQIKRSLAATQLALRAGDATLPEEIRRLHRTLDAECSQAQAMIDLKEHLLALEFDGQYGSAYPVDPVRMLADVSEQLQPLADGRGIRFDLAAPAEPVLVIVNPQSFGDTLTVLLRFLIEDAADNSTLRIELAEQGDQAEVRLANSGFGMPQDRFEADLALHGTQGDDPFAQLGRALLEVTHWGAETAVRTGVGEGFQISLTLRRFL